MTFRESALLPSSGKDAPNLLDFLVRAILSEQQVSAYLPDVGSRADFAASIFFAKLYNGHRPSKGDCESELQLYQ